MQRNVGGREGERRKVDKGRVCVTAHGCMKEGGYEVCVTAHGCMKEGGYEGVCDSAWVYERRRI